MVSALDSFEPWLSGNCVVFLGKTLNSHNATLQNKCWVYKVDCNQENIKLKAILPLQLLIILNWHSS